MTKVEFARKMIEEVRYNAIKYARQMDQDNFAEANYLRGKISRLVQAAEYYDIILDTDLDYYDGRYIPFGYNYVDGGHLYSSNYMIDTLEYLTRHLEPFNLEAQSEYYWTEIISIMDSTLREKISFDESPCTREHFLRKYCEMEPTFDQVLKDEFSITL